MSIEAYPSAASKGVIDKEAVAALAKDIATFESRFKAQTQQWQATLADIFQQGKKVVIWGSGSKGVTFLNLLNLGEKIEYAVDINPRKQGKYIPGTGQKIVAPEEMADYHPDIVIVMNPLYKQEIQDMLNEMNLNPKVLTAEALVVSG